MCSSDLVQCLECPIGTSCAIGSTLESMPLLGGYFRGSAYYHVGLDAACDNPDQRVTDDARDCRLLVEARLRRRGALGEAEDEEPATWAALRTAPMRPSVDLTPPRRGS